MNFDIESDLTVAVGINATLSGTTPAKGNVIDTQGYEALCFALMTGTVTDAGTAAGFTVSLEESDTTVNADFAAVAAADHTGDLTVTSDTDDGVPVGKIGYKGTKRYVRLSAVGTTNTAATILGMAILARTNYGPADDIAANIAAS